MSKILASRMSRLGIALLLLIPLWWVGVTSSLYAQESSSFSYSAPKRYIIKQIDVEGVQFLDKELLVQMTGLHVGDTIELPSNDITKAVKKLRRENLFSSVEIRVAHVEGEHASLVIELKEQPRVSDIRYEGVKSSARDELKDKLDFKNGQQATASTIDAAVRMRACVRRDLRRRSVSCGGIRSAPLSTSKKSIVKTWGSSLRSTTNTVIAMREWSQIRFTRSLRTKWGLGCVSRKAINITFVTSSGWGIRCTVRKHSLSSWA